MPSGLGVPPGVLRLFFLNGIAAMTLQHLSPVRQSLHHMPLQEVAALLSSDTGSAGSPAHAPPPAHAPRLGLKPALPAQLWQPPALTPWHPAAQPAVVTSGSQQTVQVLVDHLVLAGTHGRGKTGILTFDAAARRRRPRRIRPQQAADQLHVAGGVQKDERLRA